MVTAIPAFLAPGQCPAPSPGSKLFQWCAGTRQVVRAGLCHRLPADVEAPGTARRLLRDWLAAWSWQAEETVDVVLAVNEAVSNAVQHAGATRVTVEAVIDPVPDLAVDSLAGFVAIASPAIAAMDGTVDGQARRAQIEVSDNGRWRPRPLRATERYRGLVLIHACMDLVEVDATGRGTRVLLISRPAHSTPTPHYPVPGHYH